MFDKQTFLDGKLLLIDKPLHWTSFQVVNKIRWLIQRQFHLKKIKVGHAGTLDPLATGLLLICTGKLTKTIQELQETITSLRKELNESREENRLLQDQEKQRKQRKEKKRARKKQRQASLETRGNQGGELE